MTEPGSITFRQEAGHRYLIEPSAGRVTDLTTGEVVASRCPVCQHDRMKHSAWGCDHYDGDAPISMSRCGCAMPLVAITPKPVSRG